MHRTQILLEPEQYEALRELARRTGKSLGQLVREFVELGLKRAQAQRGVRKETLSSLRGFIEQSDVSGRDHDRVLYGDEQ